MNKETMEACNAVVTLNDKYAEQTEDFERFPFVLIFTGSYTAIKYFDEIVWDDQDMCADYIDYTYEETFPILDCVMERVLRIQNIVNTFKVEKESK